MEVDGNINGSGENIKEKSNFSQNSNTTKYVKINVGGNLFTTTLNTLCKQESMLKSMFTGNYNNLIDSDGYVLIDRCGKHFEKILNYFRSGKISLPKSEEEINEILDEAQYYCINELILICEKTLRNETENERIESIQKLVTDDEISPLYYSFQHSERAEEKIQNYIKSSLKPIILLKMSLETPHPDEPIKHQLISFMFSNFSFFAKMAKRTCKTVTFILYNHPNFSSSTNWEFYKNGEKVDDYKAHIYLEDGGLIDVINESHVYDLLLKLLES